MQASRLLIILLLAAAVLVDLVVLSAGGAFEDRSVDWPHPLTAVLFSLAFSQVGMASVWAGLGNTSTPWRMAGLVVVITAWSVALDATGEGHSRTEWSAFFLGHATFILPILWLVRARGGRLANQAAVGGPDSLGRWQFSLGHLFAWLTATAISLGLLRYTLDYESLRIVYYDWFDICLVGLCSAAVTLATLWATLGGSRPAWRIVVLCLTTGGVLAAFWMRDYPDLAWLLRLWTLHIAWLWAGLFVLRTAGIGFVWRGRDR